MVISKKSNFFGQTLVFLPPGKPGLYISRLLFFFFFEYHGLFKALQLTLFYHKNSKLFKNIFFLCRFSASYCGYCAVFPTLGFILLFFFIENPPSHIDIGVRLKLLHRCI